MTDQNRQQAAAVRSHLAYGPQVVSVPFAVEQIRTAARGDAQ